MEIIVPAAGLSTRYNSKKPKYLLFDVEGQLMLKRAVEQFIPQHSITIGILDEHNKSFNVEKLIADQIPTARVVVLDRRTAGPAETVYQIIQKANIKGEFFVKDCDSFFKYTYRPGNVICTATAFDYELVPNFCAKSFVVSNAQNIVLDIIEKRIVSDIFCVGGYQIAQTDLYCGVYEKLQSITAEIFVSHIIQDMIAQGEIFVHNYVDDWVDVGTITEWNAYNTKLLNE